MAKLRLATFNVENLFSRARVLNYRDKSIGDKKLEAVGQLQALLDKDVYTSQDKTDIFRMSTQELSDFIEIRENCGKLYKYSGFKPVGVKAAGRGDWDGEIVFKDAKFTEVVRTNTAQVIKDCRADVMCMVEIENLPVLRAFNSDLLDDKYKFHILLDAFDPRGIDVGLYSKYQFGTIRTHMFDKVGQSRVFSRDCLQVEVKLSETQTLHMLCNHLKSRGYGDQTENDKKRLRQSEWVAKILSGFDLKTDMVVVAGDFNDNPDSPALKPLVKDVGNLYDVLAEQYPDPAKRWTYYYDKKTEQIDFLLVSEPLKDKLVKAGVVRQGIYNLKAITEKAGGTVDIETEYPTVTNWTDAASDHGAVWAEFNI
jgi:endonuclease/exonuclease/phosphatase family metal-dependent hydrolase